jgi:DNA-binding LytR/AlgR family response regulator
MKITAFVVDDEPLARRRIRRLLDQHPDVEIVGEAAAGEEAVAGVLEKRPDVVFLDVRMPGKDGVEALREIRALLPENLRPVTVFTTAYEEHAAEAFALAGTDYLVKPIERDGLARAMRRVRRALGARGPGDEANTVATGDVVPASARERDGEGASPRAAGHIAGHRAGRIVNLVLEDIGCIAVEETITWAHTPQGKFRLRMTLQEAESRLATPPFVRVSRSAIINLDWVDHLSPMFSGTFVAVLRPSIGIEVQVSRRRARVLRDLLGW